jgi:hypothetical protein
MYSDEEVITAYKTAQGEPSPGNQHAIVLPYQVLAQLEGVDVDRPVEGSVINDLQIRATTIVEPALLRAGIYVP